MKILNLFLEVGEDIENSKFIEIPVKPKTQQEINELLERITENGNT